MSMCGRGGDRSVATSVLLHQLYQLCSVHTHRHELYELLLCTISMYFRWIALGQIFTFASDPKGHNMLRIDHTYTFCMFYIGVHVV